MGRFCSKPFEWLEVARRGATFLCCPTWLPVRTGNLRKHSLQEVWNGQAAQRIRASILDGSFRHCTEHCPWLRTESGPVARRDAVTDPRLRAIIDEQRVRLDRGPALVNAAFDRSCNLSCPSCRSEPIIESERAAEIVALQDKLEAQVLGGVEILYITGSGDAFGSPYFRRWLRRLRLDEMPRVQGIHLHTNALLWTPAMWARIPADVRALIKSCEISIDAATADTYAENRRGGSFEELLARLDFVRELRQRGPLEYQKLSFVVQANNFREMPAFAELGRQYEVDRIYFSALASWGTFSPADHARRAVHRPDHPQHAQLLEVLCDERLGEPRVDLGNLSALAPRRTTELARPRSGYATLIEQKIG